MKLILLLLNSNFWYWNFYRTDSKGTIRKACNVLEVNKLVMFVFVCPLFFFWISNNNLLTPFEMGDRSITVGEWWMMVYFIANFPITLMDYSVTPLNSDRLKCWTTGYQDTFLGKMSRGIEILVKRTQLFFSIIYLFRSTHSLIIFLFYGRL